MNQWYATERARTDARNSMKHGRGGYRTKYIVRIESVER